MDIKRHQIALQELKAAKLNNADGREINNKLIQNQDGENIALKLAG